ncbi:MAG: ATP-binding protein, partial [Bacteroidota bacterium]
SAMLAQGPHAIHFNSRTGLPSSMVYRGTMDQNGFIWFCSPMGTTRFDGRNFRHFSTDDGLPDNEILQQYVDSKNRVWMAAFSGEVAYYQEGKIHSAANDPVLEQLNTQSFAYCFLEDKKGRLWIGTYADGLAMIDYGTKNEPAKVVHFPLADTTQASKITFLAEFGDSILVLGTNLGPIDGYPVRFSSCERGAPFYLQTLPNGNLPYINTNEQYHVIPQDNIGQLECDDLPRHRDWLDILLDQRGDLWLAKSREGLYLYPKTSDPSERISISLLENKMVTSVMEDFQGGIWASTLDDGIFHLPNWRATTFNHENTPQFPDLEEQRVFANHEGTIYFSDGHGKVFSIRDNQVSQIAQRPDDFFTYPRLLLIHEGWLWVGTEQGLHGYRVEPEARSPRMAPDLKLIVKGRAMRFFREGNDYLFINLPSIKCGQVRANGKLVFGTSLGLYELDLFEGGEAPLKLIGPGWLSTMYEDEKGGIWYGTRTGIFHHDGTAARPVDGLNEKIPSQLNHVTGRGDNLLVFSSHGNGLFIVEDQQVRQIGTVQGLASSICNQALISEEGDIWVATNKGLNRIHFTGPDREQYEISVMTEYDGLGENDIKSIAIRGENVIACTNHGFTILPKAAADNRKAPPRISLESVYLSGERQELRTVYELPWSGQEISLNFAGLDYQNPAGLRYAYRWVERDTAWTMTEFPGLQIEGLPYGENTLAIRVRTTDGRESTGELRLKFTVRFPVWRQAWFIPLLVLVLGGLAYLFFRFRTYQLQRTQAELSRQVRARTRELELANEEILKQKEKAEAADKAKSEFLATMSHEIRTPLNGVIGLTDLVLQTELDEPQAKLAENIRLSGRMLLSLINDILDFSKIEAGQLEIASAPFDLPDTLAQIVRLQHPIAREKGLDLHFAGSERLPRAVLGDEVRLRQILVNLLGNAIKFTERGSVELRAEWQPGAEAGSGTLRCTVTDTGIGISAEKQEYLFQRFHQVDASITRRYGGSGLGLAICSHLCQLMGGEISVASQVGRGSAFTFALPLAVIPESELPAQNPAFDRSGAFLRSDLSILVVDDNQVNLLVASGMLAQLGLACATVENGRAAVEAVATGAYDLVLMDVQMPEMDGTEATRRIRELAHLYPQPVIVAMTANAFAEQQREYLESGMDDFLSKPFTLDQFRTVIARNFRGQVAGEEDVPEASEGEVAQNAGVETVGYDLSGLLEIGGGDEAFLALVLDKTVESLAQCGQQMEVARAGEDWKTLSALAHKLKSTTLNLGARCLSGQLGQLEQLARGAGETAEINELARECSTEIARLLPQLKAEREARRSKLL